AGLESSCCTEALLDDRDRPDERTARASATGISTRVARCVRQTKTTLHRERETDRLVDAREAELRMQAEEAERLRIECDGTPTRDSRLTIVRHQIDGDVHADDEAIEQTEVDLTRSLERVIDESAGRLPDHRVRIGWIVRIGNRPDVLVGAKKIVSVIDDQ